MSYPFQSIEKKWQDFWEKNHTFQTVEKPDRPFYYVLDMFPYPSGSGLHVGHPEGYTATDIIARYRRMKGYNVLHPMGWDAFGLPAERYAMQTGIHPAKTTQANIDNFRRQLKALGFSYDWSREVNTTDPNYYRWTQWIFLKIFNSFFDKEQNRARPIEELPTPEELNEPENKRQKEEYINNHRLAYVAEAPVNYCAELGTVLANEEVDEWTEKGYTVERRPMRQWMLRITAYAERLLEDLKDVDWPQGTLELQKNWIGRSEGASIEFPIAGNPEKSLQVFTTRPDTIFGVTYMVLAPEHPDIPTFTTDEHKAAVEKYVKNTALKSELDRTIGNDKTTKSGVFTGGYVFHPFSEEKIPVYTADYVLMGYGTGAIMAVPAHDERDFAFAREHDLAVRTVVAEDPDDFQDIPDQVFSGEGFAVNSPVIEGMPTDRAKKAIIEHIEKTGRGKREVQYRLRDWLFSRQRYWGEPIPISFKEDETMIAENEEHLPLLLPPCEDFQPAATGESPLANIEDWVCFEHPEHGMLRRETNTMPQWAGSCWYYLRFISPDYNEGIVDKEKEKNWLANGVDLYVGGAEHAVLHLLYSRFWHKILYDYGLVSSKEPFRKLIHQGLILGEDGAKMSKSLGNVVNPDEVVENYGADAFRLYEMFLGPLEVSKPWSSKGIEGVFRFLSRVWRLYTIADIEKNDNGKAAENEKEAANLTTKIDPELLKEPEADRVRQVERLMHETIKKVSEDIEKMAFNTAISSMMIFVNETFTPKAIGRDNAEKFLILLSPFAPHIAEELYQSLTGLAGISEVPWPAYDEAKLVQSEIEIVFQINGKVKGKSRLAVDLDDEQMKQAALDNEGVQKALQDKEIRKIIDVKNKLVNIVA